MKKRHLNFGLIWTNREWNFYFVPVISGYNFKSEPSESTYYTKAYYLEWLVFRVKYQVNGVK